MAQKKIALVTGGSRGLGKNMALSLAKKGLHVILTYKTGQEEAAVVVSQVEALGGEAIALRLDVSAIHSIDDFLVEVKTAAKKQWESENIDYLINNAGIGASIPISQLSKETFDQFVDVHFKGVLFLTQKALPMMNDGGGVIFISSGSTRFNVPGYGIYASCKGAIEVFSRSVAKEFGYRKIRSNVIAPGAIETDFNGGRVRNDKTTQQFIIAQTALGRVGYPDDIGGIVAVLCTEDAKWINGQRIEISGGMLL